MSQGGAADATSALSPSSAATAQPLSVRSIRPAVDPSPGDVRRPAEASHTNPLGKALPQRGQPSRAASDLRGPPRGTSATAMASPTAFAVDALRTPSAAAVQGSSELAGPEGKVPAPQLPRLHRDALLTQPLSGPSPPLAAAAAVTDAPPTDTHQPQLPQLRAPRSARGPGGRTARGARGGREAAPVDAVEMDPQYNSLTRSASS